MPVSELRAQIEAGEVHVWLARPGEIGEAGLIERYRGMVTAAERERGERFRFERHRDQYWVTRALVRTCLSRYFAVEPGDWRFEPDADGRPFVVAPVDIAPLSFNLSHTDGLIACALSWGAVVGCDVEDLSRRVEGAGIASRFFARPEVECLEACDPRDRRVRFLEFWTLKEAYVKARGTGLRTSLQSFSFSMWNRPGGRADAPPDRIRIEFHGLDDDPAGWWFSLRRVDAQHVLALAVASSRARPIRLRECVPLREP